MGESRIIVSYMELRRLIGLIGITHPFILLLGGWWIFGLSLQDSMSHYYYTGMRDVFVGFGFVTGVFLLCYRGYDLHDRVVSFIAGAATLVVALFPTSPLSGASEHQMMIAKIHALAALTFLASIAYFSLVLFPRGDSSAPRKKSRNLIYRVCGSVIVVCLLAVIAYLSVPGFEAKFEHLKPIYFIELFSFVAFGTAWLVKGQAILADK